MQKQSAEMVPQEDEQLGCEVESYKTLLDIHHMKMVRWELILTCTTVL